MFGTALGTTTTTTATGLGGLGGFSLGATQQPANAFAGGFGSTAPTGAFAAATPAVGGFSVGGGAQTAAAPAQKAVRFDAGSTTTQSAASPFTFSGLSAPAVQTSAPAAGLSFATPSATTSTLAGLLSGNKPTLSFGPTTTAPATAAGGLGFPSSGLGAGLSLTAAAPTTSAPFGFGAMPATPSLGLGIGGLGSTATTSNIFGTTATSSSVTQGLGGVDPKLANYNSSASGGSNKKCDGRALKENPIDPILLNSIEEFTKHLKNQKNIRENISRMSSKPLLKVKEEIKNLQQQLMLVSNGLQKNSTAIEKLKREATQELKNAEMAQRTKETPSGLQFENTAPTDYFHRLTEGFETQMILYRQQIQDMENHLISLNQSSMLTPQELLQLFAKLNAGFTALASQLQVVHEAVRDQKEQYLEFRKLYHGDTKDIFARRKKVQDSITKSIPSTVGPTPFSTVNGISAMASSCQPCVPQQTTGSSTVTGFANPQQCFGQTAGGTGSLFGSTAAPRTGVTFGGAPATGGTGLFGGGSGGFCNGSGALAPAPALSFNTAVSTPAQKPFGSKRGKNA